MYMYKRNAQQQSISEFIKDSSIQEEETDCKEIEKSMLQKDEDFMFQMDKGIFKILENFFFKNLTFRTISIKVPTKATR